METGKPQISNFQLMFLMAGLMMGSFQLAGAATAFAQNAAWLTVLPALGEGLVLVLIFVSLAHRFPGKTLVEINEQVFGTVLGKALSILYVWFFLHIAAANFRYIGDYMTLLLPETPLLIIIISFCLLCASAVRNGIEVIARISEFLVPLVTLMVFTTVILLLNEMDLKNIYPLMDITWKDFIKTQHTIASISFGELIVFTMVIANVKKAKKTFLPAILASSFFTVLILLIILRNILVLGNVNAILIRPSFETVKMINIVQFLSRLEIIIILNELTMSLVKISVFYYAAVLATAQIIKLRTYLPLVLPMGALLTSLSILMYDFAAEYFHFAGEIFPYYSIPFEIILPLGTFLLAVIRRLPREDKK